MKTALRFLFFVFPWVGALASPFLEKVHLFEEKTDGFVSYRIPGIVVTAKGTVLVFCEARKYSGLDWGEIELHGVNANYSLNRRYSLYASVVDWGGFVQNLQRYSPSTPNYAKPTRWQELGSYSNLGIRGSF
jgi:hypothetical protein